jgi:hypothetical protein
VTDGSLRGAIVWAVAPYVPEAPFRVWGGPAGRVATIGTALELARLVVREGLDPEQTFLTSAKLRPVLILQDRPRRVLREVAALRLVRLEELGAADRERIRQGDDRSLFYLRARSYGLAKESAADVHALLRIHESAIAGQPVGRLNAEEMRAVGERIVEALDIDVSRLVAQKAAEFVARLTGFPRRPP